MAWAVGAEETMLTNPNCFAE
jgi:hypothetical protein